MAGHQPLLLLLSSLNRVDGTASHDSPDSPVLEFRLQDSRQSGAATAVFQTAAKTRSAATVQTTVVREQVQTRVPDTFQFGAISWYCAFLADRKINNLRVFNSSTYSDSPRLHHSKVWQSVIRFSLRRPGIPVAWEAATLCAHTEIGRAHV